MTGTPVKFELDTHEINEFTLWNVIHLSKHHNGVEPYGGAIGGRLTYKFTPTSIGVIASVKCSCGEEQTLSDFTTW